MKGRHGLWGKPKGKPALRVDAPAEVTQRVQRRLRDTADEVARGQGEADGSAFWELFPRFKEAVDALPELTPLMRCAREMRVLPLDGYRAEGVVVPGHLWRALGLTEPT